MENIQEHKQTVGTMESYIKYIMSISKYKMHQHLYINSYNKRLTKIFEVDDKIIFEMNPKLYLENDVQSSMFSIGSISNVEFIKDAYKIWCNENLEINIIQKESFKNNKIKNYKFIKPNELDKNYHLLNGMSAKYEKNKDDELIRIILYKKNKIESIDINKLNVGMEVDIFVENKPEKKSLLGKLFGILNI